MDFGNGVKIDFRELPDERLRAIRAEVDAAGGERGLWVPEGAGSLAVATTVDIPSLRSELLESVEEGATLFNGAIEYINANRNTKDRIPVTPAGEYRERAKDWLTDSRVLAAAQLPTAADRPLLVIPRPGRYINHSELVASWGAAAYSRPWGWEGRRRFLHERNANQLSGHDPKQEDSNRLSIVPTAYDKNREGTVAQQRENLEALQSEFPELDVATLFDGAVLARRYRGQPRRWRDSYVRAINLKPTWLHGDDCVPAAGVFDGGSASVDASNVAHLYAARLRVI